MSGVHIDFEEIADRRAAMYVDLEVLHGLMGLPGNCQIRACRQDEAYGPPRLRIFLVCSDFLSVPDGCLSPSIDAVFKTENGRPVFVGWETRKL